MMLSFGEDSYCEDCIGYSNEANALKDEVKLLNKKLEAIKDYLIDGSQPVDGRMMSMNEMMGAEDVRVSMEIMLRKFFGGERL